MRVQSINRRHHFVVKVRSSNSRGQALVLVLLSLAVVLTMVLFVMARSVTDVAVSSSSEASVRAFSAAEAGVERALVVGMGTVPLTTVGDAQYTSTTTAYAAGGNNYNYPVALSSGDSMTTWFVSHDSATGNLYTGATLAPICPCFRGTQMTVCWGKKDTDANIATTPAIEVSVFYKNAPAQLNVSSLRIARITADPNAGRIASNKFGAKDNVTSCTISGVTYAFQKTFRFGTALGTIPGLGIPVASYNVNGGLQFAQVRMLYNTTQTHPVGITVVQAAGSSLPSQGLDINSTGKAGGANRKVAVFQSWPEVPTVFNYAVYSGSTYGLRKP